MAKVVDSFWLTGRGLVIAIDTLLPETAGREVVIDVTTPEGAFFSTGGFHELICHSTSPLHESSAVYLPNIHRDAVPIGSHVEVHRRA
jgi:hypothetical protein